MLRASGMRATSARIAVLEVLLGAKSPMSHAEVCDQVGERGIDRATLYRNLIDLADANLVRRSDHGDHVWRFEWIGRASPHDVAEHAHFVCSVCAGVSCLPTGAIAVQAVRGAPRSLRTRVEVQVRGICDSCG
jgi:Fur family ferric uptake transcriptional regulator